MSVENELSPEAMGINPEDFTINENNLEIKMGESIKNREQATAGQELVDYFTKKAEAVNDFIAKLQEEKVNTNDNEKQEIDKRIAELNDYVKFAQDKVKEGESQRDEFDRLSKEQSTPEVIAKIQEQVGMNQAIIDLDRVESVDKVMKGDGISDKVIVNLKRAAAVLAVFVAIGPTASKAQEEKGWNLIWKDVMSIVKPETTDYAKGLIKQGIEYDKIKEQWELLKKIESNVKEMDYWIKEFRDRSHYDWSQSNPKRYEYRSSLKLGNGTHRGHRSDHDIVAVWFKDLADIIDNFNKLSYRLDKEFSQADGRIINITDLQQRVLQHRDELVKMRKGLDSHFNGADVLPAVVEYQQK